MLINIKSNLLIVQYLLIMILSVDFVDSYLFVTIYY